MSLNVWMTNRESVIVENEVCAMSDNGVCDWCIQLCMISDNGVCDWCIQLCMISDNGVCDWCKQL